MKVAGHRRPLRTGREPKSSIAASSAVGRRRRTGAVRVQAAGDLAATLREKSAGRVDGINGLVAELLRRRSSERRDASE